MNQFDIIFVYTQFREVNQYPNIAKFLSGKYQIGILNVPQSYLSSSLVRAKQKILNSDRVVLDLCRKLGATILDKSFNYYCKLLIVPQSFSSLKKGIDNIRFEKAVAIERFGSGARGLRKLKEYGVEEFWVYQKKIFENIVAQNPEQSVPKDMRIVEMGSLYARYPVFDFSLLKIDYIVAMPTVMLIRDSEKRHNFLCNLIRFIRKIQGSSKIVFKAHNVKDIVSYYGIKRMINTSLKIVEPFLKNQEKNMLDFFVNKSNSEWLKTKLRYFQDVLTDIRIEKKTILLQDLTPYSNFGIEHFIPFVREGIITGISSCQWHALYNNIPVYNCDDQRLHKKLPNYEVYKNFLVEPCHEPGTFNHDNYLKISGNCRKADMIKMIEAEIE